MVYVLIVTVKESYKICNESPSNTSHSPIQSITLIHTIGAKWQFLNQIFPNLADAFLNDGSAVGNPQQQAVADSSRFEFEAYLPVPPRYVGVPKVYPSEKNGKKQGPNITNLSGQQVRSF